MNVFRGKNNEKDLFQLLPQAIAGLKKTIIDPLLGDNVTEKYANEQPPLRSEIFTKEKLEAHAVAIAKRHELTLEKTEERLLKRLAENEHILLEVYALLSETLKQNNRISPAAEWLLDNFYLIEEQIYTGKKHLPKGYSKALPRLLKGESANLPRVYDMAVEIISHSDGHVDNLNLISFVKAYQTVSYLKLGELWAIPIMLRLALIENLRRLAVIISEEIRNKALADRWADEMIEIVESDPKNLVLIIADMARSAPPMVSTFVAELHRRLQEKGNAISLALSWIEQRLSEMGLTSNEMIRLDNRNQAATQVSVSNCISSFRFLSTANWKDFIEDTGVVEAILRQDINGIYGKMDFHTRDSYRHAVEKIAKCSKLSEPAVAEMVVNAAKSGDPDNENTRLSHVGYYLTGKGYRATAKAAFAHKSVSEQCKTTVAESPLLVYLGGIWMLSLLFCWLLIAEAVKEPLPIGILIAVCIISFISTTRLAVSLVNWLSTILADPSLLPRMDYSKGISDDARTMVVIPSMITDFSGLETLIEGLEVRFLANKEANLYFALLTDFRDAPTEHLPEDTLLLTALKNRISDLNKKYRQTSEETFLLFHRPRRWNKKDKIWMGYERKRGKLSELNAVLRNKGEGYFSEIIGDRAIFSSIKYIITLDTDTQLSRDTARQMIGTIAHPLNQPVYSEKKKRVTEGYSILQPRVSNTLPASDSSLYARLHGNDPGTDPYTKATSDVYQDLFHEGSFIGKGIYNLDAFELALKDRFPENRILSHDLLEGCYAGSGLITDVQLFEEYPLRYDTDMQRRHRWIRGDWQIAGWVLPFVRGNDGKFHKNPLSVLSKWKIFDNLRRSLVPVCLLLLLLFGWTLSSAAWFWTLAVTIIIILPSVVNAFRELIKKPADVVFKQHIAYTIRSAFSNFNQQLLELIFLPYEVYSGVDAIVRTFWRMVISNKNLLQWNIFSSRPNRQNGIVKSYIKMWFEPAFAFIIYAWLTIYNPNVVLIALPFLTFWMMAPFIAHTISRPLPPDKNVISTEQTIYLGMLARKIWNFFEKYVTPEDNWLPPDNYQAEPVERLARRTSPTNIGLLLLSNLTAYDFGYITISQFIERTGNTITTLRQMQRYRGHFYNWYDTGSLAPLFPRYISTVDSGNLAGHLLTLKQGLLSIINNKIVSHSFFKGLCDTLSVLAEYIEQNETLVKFRLDIEEKYPQLNTVGEIKDYAEQLETMFINILLELEPDEQAGTWVQKVLLQLSEQKENIRSLVPWLLYTKAPPKFETLLRELPGVPTLKQITLIEQLLLQKIISFHTEENTHEENDWLTGFRTVVTQSSRRAKEVMLTVERLADDCIDLANIDYDFLYDKSQNLLAIGYNADEHRRDPGFYDLLASEARLTTFMGIAMGKLPQESWFALGRKLTNQGNNPVLLSWGGSMFEYLMPLLVMPGYENTLLDQTNKAVVQKQIEYGKKHGIPWGISESGFNTVDAHLNYQYKSFGVPGLGFKRGLGEDLVISPYSAVMALMVSPVQAYKNIQVLKDEGYETDFGFYEAVDYTVSRLLKKQKRVIIKSFMAHHQGMSFLSISYLLHNKPMQQRFESEVHFKSALLLLQERIPRISTFYAPSVHAGDASIVSGSDQSVRIINTPNTVTPEIQLLSNGRYHVMITNAGGGYSRWKNLAVTRWREDITCDNWGNFCYIRDTESNLFWSSAYQPSLQQ